ncbi:DUF4097 family beta strand repeat-containing protein [Flavobacteriaceae bacterium F08102]|nr:DUF4097 family beta strand repeat-containing protein [Flavobacteriaceae bacterium F08102]
MRTKLCKYVFLFLWVPMALMARNSDELTYDKTKIIKKEFFVDANAKLDITNKYGDVNILTWNENRIIFEIKIEVNGTDASKVAERLHAITVDFQSSQSLVTAKTKIEKLKKSWGKKNSVHYKIDYTVKMPLTNNLQVSNDYGAIYLNELKGMATLNCDYGNVFIGELHHKTNSINLDYCNGSTIRNMFGGQINADYSKFTLSQGGEVNLVADYSTSVFEEINTLSYQCDYGSLRVEEGGAISGTADYMSAKFEKINKRLHADADYGSIRIESIGDQFESVKLTTDYCSIKVGVPETAFTFNLDLRYSGFKYEEARYEIIQKIEKSNTKLYRGYYKSAKTKASIDVSSNYGSVRFF